MKATLKFVVSSVVFLFLSACGGSDKTELEGTWVYASAGHTTGSTCGRDIHGHGNHELRATFIFEGTAIRGYIEACESATGNIGGFIQIATMAGTFVLGEAYMIAGDDTYKTIDITDNQSTQYLGYSLTGNTLKFAEATAENDGSTSAKRQRGAGTLGLIKQ